MRKIEYSQIVRRKLKIVKTELTAKYGEEFSKKSVGNMMSTIRRLELFSNSGIRIADMYEIDTDYYYIFVNHNYFIYRMEKDKIIVVNMFHEKEDFMLKLFGISGRTQESIDYWGE